VSELDRVRWQCRRGMLELDLLLQRFGRQQLERLDPGQLQAFEELLKLPDNDLFDVIMGRVTPVGPGLGQVLEMLRAA
jgi:antitoxin CptB